jgi:hypothetical protein
MISKDKQYRTRDGREVRIYATDGGGSWPVHGAILEQRGWVYAIWSEDGVCQYDRRCDLIEVKPRHKRTVWLNVYEANAYTIHDSAEDARLRQSQIYDRIACIKVDLDFEEGEGL